jgi:hypothetical protein
MQMILLSPIIVPIAIVALPLVVLPLVVTDKLEQWRRARNRAQPKRLWFAWRPVRFSGFWDDVPDQWLWLEKVDAIWRRGEWEYRPLGFVSRFDEQSNDMEGEGR